MLELLEIDGPADDRKRSVIVEGQEKAPLNPHTSSVSHLHGRRCRPRPGPFNNTIYQKEDVTDMVGLLVARDESKMMDRIRSCHTA